LLKHKLDSLKLLSPITPNQDIEPAKAKEFLDLNSTIKQSKLIPALQTDE
jgi:hypothetical protein